MLRSSPYTISLTGAAFVCLAVAAACELEFQQYPEKFAGLTPLRVPVEKSETVRASFKAVWSEPHYLALVFSSGTNPEVATLLDQASASVGSTKTIAIAFDFDWRAFEGTSEVGRGSGRNPLTGVFGTREHGGLMFGEFPVIAGKTYHVEIQPGPAFAPVVQLKPTMEVGVNRAGPSIGLPWVKEFSRPIAIILAALGLMFLSGAIWTMKK